MYESHQMDIKKIANALLATLKFKQDYDEQSGLRKRILLVEGRTDQAFFKRIARNDARYICVSDFIGGHMSVETSKPPALQWLNNKDVIVNLIKNFLIPGPLGLPTTASSWPLYGLIDSDFDLDYHYSRYNKLFFTGTHDIETLMLSTDKGLLLRLPDCTIHAEEVMRALYIAAQLSVFRQVIYKSGSFRQLNVTDSEGVVNYSAFTSDGRISFHLLLDYINKNSERPLSKEKMKKIKEKISIENKKSIDEEGFWKKSYEAFSNNVDNDFWRTVNGHDILSAIRYLNRSAQEHFTNNAGYRVNRDFELALSNEYDYTCFVSTDLYSHLISTELILPCEPKGTPA